MKLVQSTYLIFAILLSCQDQVYSQEKIEVINSDSIEVDTSYNIFFDALQVCYIKPADKVNMFSEECFILGSQFLVSEAKRYQDVLHGLKTDYYSYDKPREIKFFQYGRLVFSHSFYQNGSICSQHFFLDDEVSLRTFYSKDGKFKKTSYKLINEEIVRKYKMTGEGWVPND